MSDCLQPHGLYVHGILQARKMQWVPIPFSSRSFQPRDWTQVSHTAGRFLTIWASREAQEYWSGSPTPSPRDLPNPGIEPGSPVLQVDSLPAELQGKPLWWDITYLIRQAALKIAIPYNGKDIWNLYLWFSGKEWKVTQLPKKLVWHFLKSKHILTYHTAKYTPRHLTQKSETLFPCRNLFDH